MSSHRLTIGALGLLCSLLGGCAIGMPFRGPQYAGGVITGVAPDALVVVAVTEAQVDHAQRRLFSRQIEAVMAVIQQQPGYLGGTVRRELLGSGGWTMTVWRSDDDVDAFYRSPAHREAMRTGMPTLISFRSVRFTVPAKDIPLTWSEAQRRLAEVPLTVGPAAPAASGEATKP
jgi:heme-degrading monooxygenase HmoA